jgi:hypothetical protein
VKHFASEEEINWPLLWAYPHACFEAAGLPLFAPRSDASESEPLPASATDGHEAAKTP